MLDKNRHKIVLVKILKEIYSDPTIRNILGFKGGTAAYLFYGLPRFSVDLDFDLLEEKKKDFVFVKLKEILPKVETLIESTKKRYTLFYLMSYEKGERKIKIEISSRQGKNSFVVRSYLGIPILLMAKKDMAAGKLAAFLTRKKFAARDLFDLWFFLKNNWEIDGEVLKEKTSLTLKTAIEKAIEKIKKIKKNQLLQGLGELLDEKQKPWVKENIQKEALFYLKYLLEEL
ncbi:MAG: nucleotidyl transferase AbiEii/AbiGii toxin family protein [Actinobacteria bacterium]|nr:nucleotidyl transferase AbiEii/AbiGii toxin family protein [Actinomycetota bacterium]